MEALPATSKENIIVDIILAEALKTSAIEGEFPMRKEVLSSIRKNLGLHTPSEPIIDRSAVGLGELMIEMRNSFREPLSDEKLFKWHRMLLGENKQIQVGQWRSHEEPMQIISGAMGKEKIHFEAPPSSSLHEEMLNFIQWFNDTAPGVRTSLKKLL